jgi:hypothetical protein
MKPIVSMLAIFGVAIVISIGVASAYLGNPGFMGPNYNEEVHEQLRTAIESGDYEQWVQIREEYNLPMRGKMDQLITEENFALFQQLHEAVMSGDTETAGQIREELGLGIGKMFMHRWDGEGDGQHNHMNGMGPMGPMGPIGPEMRLVDADGDGYCDLSEQGGV